MTIKQNGGIFGRNPTFNDVTIDGELSTSGAFNPSGDLTLGGDFSMSSATPNIKITDTDLAHGMTTLTETDTLLTQAPETASSGGVRWSAYSASAIAMQFAAYSTTPSTDGNGAVFRFRAAKKSGTTETSLADGEDIVTFGNTGTEVVTIKGNGNIVLADGAGIDFSATSDASGSSSELFDDYEEGTWTPSLSATSGSATITQAVGVYEKIGAMVRVGCRMECLVGTLSGNVSVTGLPYSSANITAGDVTTTPLFFENLATNSINVFGAVSSNSATISLRALTAAAATSGAFTEAYIRSSNPKTLIYFTATYRAA